MNLTAIEDPSRWLVRAMEGEEELGRCSLSRVRLYSSIGIVEGLKLSGLSVDQERRGKGVATELLSRLGELNLPGLVVLAESEPRTLFRRAGYGVLSVKRNTVIWSRSLSEHILVLKIPSALWGLVGDLAHEEWRIELGKQ
jgi:hypothetical protein